MNKEIEEIRHWKAVSERRYEIIKEQQQKIEQLENQLYISDKAHQRVCAENAKGLARNARHTKQYKGYEGKYTGISKDW